ncbi:MAG: TetR family transcriptional regulator [Bacteroidota bacterium]|nr:TetR family transcriptional regulator [Bacteroidota bacterium]MDP4212520.1 TetR family transcriptional regulator [Bacteroidota bacterium]MDP4250522.1 TetR family transcriptional regulator [Bacteroidota bacterium]
MKKKAKAEIDLSTEEKIKEAARKVFTRKGYAATRTRDIAEEAGLNLALLNYYFRSKSKLFEMIMAEKMQQFFGFMLPVINNADTSVQEKVELITSKYMELLMENPDLPYFVLSEIRNTPDYFMKITDSGNFLSKSIFIRQIREKAPGRNPFHYLINLLGMCVFPFIMNPVLQKMGALDEKTFAKMMKERKTLIPAWIKSMLEED